MTHGVDTEEFARAVEEFARSEGVVRRGRGPRTQPVLEGWQLARHRTAADEIEWTIKKGSSEATVVVGIAGLRELIPKGDFIGEGSTYVVLRIQEIIAQFDDEDLGRRIAIP